MKKFTLFLAGFSYVLMAAWCSNLQQEEQIRKDSDNGMPEISLEEQIQPASEMTSLYAEKEEAPEIPDSLTYSQKLI